MPSSKTRHQHHDVEEVSRGSGLGHEHSVALRVVQLLFGRIFDKRTKSLRVFEFLVFAQSRVSDVRLVKD